MAFSLIWNVTLLVGGRQLYAERADLTRAFVVLGTTDPLPPGVAPNLSLLLVPSPDELRRVLATYGSPMTDSLAPGSVPPISEGAIADATDAPRTRPTGCSLYSLSDYRMTRRDASTLPASSRLTNRAARPLMSKKTISPSGSTLKQLMRRSVGSSVRI